MVDYRSYSQLSKYKQCPQRYYLSYRKRAWSRPAAWLPQGTAFHAAAEAWERSGRTLTLEQTQDVFRDEYAKEVTESADVTPNLEYWFSSGPYKAGEESVRRGKVYTSDIERRYQIGLEQVAGFIEYYLSRPNETPWTTPDGTIALELPFEVDLGGVVVRGYIDKVESIVHPDGRTEIRVRDYKTGKEPGDELQLATYAVALNDQYGTAITTGDYWMAQHGGPTKKVYQLTEWTKERLIEEYGKVDELIRSESFDPAPEYDKCGRCDVETSCPFSALRS